MECPGNLTRLTGLFVNRKKTALLLEARDKGTLFLDSGCPDFVDVFYSVKDLNHENYELILAVTPFLYDFGDKAIFYRPLMIHLGLGCQRGIPSEEFRQTLEKSMHKQGLSLLSVASLNTASLKKDEDAFLYLCREWQVSLHDFSGDILDKYDVPNPSEKVETVTGSPGVAEAAAMHQAQNQLLIEKMKLKAGEKYFTYAAAIDAQMERKGFVEFVGAGPGDPELVSVKGKRLLQTADYILYAGSLVPRELTCYAKPGCVVESSAGMDLQTQLESMKHFYDKGLSIVRLHTGDPCIYGAIQEQMAIMDQWGWHYHITPGISSFQAAAAALRSQFTIPEEVQTIILTRGEGRTPMPVKEELHKLAQSQSTMCIYLSASIAPKVQKELLMHYPPETPVAVCYKLTWSDGKIYRCTLDTLAQTVEDHQLTMTTLIVVGKAIDNRSGESKLYNRKFAHAFRKHHTTEGKKTAELLDFINEPYFYSTKTKTDTGIHGKSISGGMDPENIIAFCRENKVRLLIDAAHPFAVILHNNIHTASQQLEIPVLRYERDFPEILETKNRRFFSSFGQLADAIQQSKYKQILALTGVQTIDQLKRVWEGRNCYFRILDTALSRQKAALTGIDPQWIIPMNPSASVDELVDLAGKLKTELLLSKESGTSGFMQQKLEASECLKIPIWIVKRPSIPAFDFVIHNQKELLQHIYKLRKSVLKRDGILRSGFTTGTCVTAAVKACFMAINERVFPKSVNVLLPDGEQTGFLIFPESLSDKSAACTVIKDAGDDPDVTHGKEIGCELTLTEQSGICFLQGEGIGRVTLPGLSLPVGEPAINPVPREMITKALEVLSEEYEVEAGFMVKPFIPEGEELAKQTFNSRVGIVGGISIIGTTGKVMPYSNEAFRATIKYQLSVAHQSGCQEVVFTSGKRSENQLRSGFPHLPDTAFIHFGNLIGDSIQLAVQQEIRTINLALMFGKAVKLAEGYLDTHSKQVRFNAGFMGQIASECGYPSSTIRKIEELELANAVFSILPVSTNKAFYHKIAKKCYAVCNSLIIKGYKLVFILLLEDGNNRLEIRHNG